MNKPLLSLVMIVKDEAPAIRQTIESCQGAVDRFTILDTGSTDGTQLAIQDALADVPGALFEEPFIDFASSRNRALDLEAGSPAPAEFALSLSADEVLHGGAALREFLENQRVPRDGGNQEGAYLVELRTQDAVSLYPRVLRVGGTYRYEGEVHERPLDRVNQRDPSVRIPGVSIEHRGTDPERRLRRLRERDVPGLRKQVRDPNLDPASRLRAVILLAQTHEEIAGAEPSDVLSWLEHLGQALSLYMYATQIDGGGLDAVNYARFRHAVVCEALHLWGPEDVLRQVAPLAQAEPRRPEFALMVAIQLAKLDARAGLEKALLAARVARDARLDSPYVLSDPNCLWRAHLVAAHCARHVGQADAVRKSVEAGLRAGGPREAFAELGG